MLYASMTHWHSVLTSPHTPLSSLLSFTSATSLHGRRAIIWAPLCGRKTRRTMASADQVRWQYYLSNSVDGKGVGWYDYDLAASDKLETKWQQQLGFGAMHRTTWHLKSGYFSYEVNLGSMTQKNMTSGTVRHVRRLDTSAAANATPPNPTVKHAAADHDADIVPKAKKLKVSGAAPAGAPLNLNLGPVFLGQHGKDWQASIASVLEAAPDAAVFIGPNRDKTIMPVRELTFQALKPNPPAAWRVIAFGQNPYPRLESATGIAMFDNTINAWTSPSFGKAVSMRCIVKAAAMHKHGIPVDMAVGELRANLAKWKTVQPPQWFEAMLTQGVLLLNAALTIGGSSLTKAQHVKFWKPVVAMIVRQILTSKQGLPDGHAHKGVVMLWWGNESLKVKKFLASVIAEFPDVPITHMEHCNPAAQGDLFCKGKVSHFTAVNTALKSAGQQPIDWLPDSDWLGKNVMSAHSAFITETQDLHKMYLERMQAGLTLPAKLEPIEGVLKTPLQALPKAVKAIGLADIGMHCVTTASAMATPELSEDEKGAIFMYTGNSLYSALNSALRNPDRTLAIPYFGYLHLFINAHKKLPGKKSTTLFRGIRKDLTPEYKKGSMVTWWSVSSCTPSIEVAKNFGGGFSNGTLFHVTTTTAAPIMALSAYKSEEEWILAPGTQLKVVSVTKKAGQAGVIKLEEVEGVQHVK